jgi:hypothetical protein
MECVGLAIYHSLDLAVILDLAGAVLSLFRPDAHEEETGPSEVITSSHALLLSSMRVRE